MCDDDDDDADYADDADDDYDDVFSIIIQLMWPPSSYWNNY